jgi:DNA polymerase III delta prime subunit|tara:strand:+ start:1635 stop:2915 length:1281 start_codon:yes stop_codon:yes gene_type:complete
MDNLDFNNILDREILAEKIRVTLIDFEKNKHDLTRKRGIYIYGSPGCGKTTFVKNLIKSMDYDIVLYDAGDIRNKMVIDNITKNNMSDRNVISLFNKKKKQIAIIMDEIDGMNNGDKGGINSLIKQIRPKKTKKQKEEESTNTPIICISNYHVDKKIKELMKVCSVFELSSPTDKQINSIIRSCMPNIDETLNINIKEFIKSDLRKLRTLYDIYVNHQSILKNEIIKNILKPKSYNEDTKTITKKLINNSYSLNDHQLVMNETDRTIVGLLWHENIVDMMSAIPKETAFPLYEKFLDNICFADYIDRITFQKQIWQFNEMSSLIKTFENNRLYSKYAVCKFNPEEVRFTKVLTKYSTEYNNSIFIQEICQALGMDIKDVFAFFIELKHNNTDEEINNILDPYEINKLDIKRIYKYLDNYTNNHTSI